MFTDSATGLLIRPWRLSDAAALRAAVVNSLDHLRPFMPWVRAEPLSVTRRREMIREWRRGAERGGDLVYGLFAGDTVAGGCGLHRRIGPGGLEIGYWVHVDHVRRGYATAAARCMARRAFREPAVERVEIHHDRANTPSGMVARRLGFTLVEEVERHVDAPSASGVICVWRLQRESPAARSLLD